MEWLKKLGAAIDYIEDNLDKEISYDKAAQIACCSPYYFQLKVEITGGSAVCHTEQYCLPFPTSHSADLL